MKVHTKTFATLGEAEAFVEGVAFVNDSSLQWHEPDFYRKRWRVVMHDLDDVVPNDSCPICRKEERHERRKNPPDHREQR